MSKNVMKFMPVIVFIVALTIYDIYIATGALAIAYGIKLIHDYFTGEKITKLQIGLFVFLLIAATATILFREPLFIKWKVSIVLWLAGIFMLSFKKLKNEYASEAFINKTLKEGLEKEHPGIEFAIPSTAYRKIDLLWSLSLIIFGGLNLVVAYTMSDTAWGYFKFGGLLVMQLALCVISIAILYKYLPKELLQEEQEKTSEE